MDHQMTTQARDFLDEAAQILEQFPDGWRPDSDIRQMRELAISG